MSANKFVVHGYIGGPLLIKIADKRFRSVYSQKYEMLTIRLHSSITFCTSESVILQRQLLMIEIHLFFLYLQNHNLVHELL